MHKKLAALAVGSLVAVLLALNLSASSTAATPGVDLGITGVTAAGVTSSQTGIELPFIFTATNHSTTTSTDLQVRFTVTHGTAALEDYICPLISNHFAIDADTPTCEIGTLRRGKSTGAAILVTPTSTGTLIVKACAFSYGTTDPVSSNNCKTISVPIG